MGTILLAEDAPHLQTMYKKWLETAHFVVETASDGNEALDKARARRFDGIVMDYALPGLNGLAVARILRDDRPIPIIMMTAMGFTDPKIREEIASFDGFFEKPFDPRSLIACLREKVGVKILAVEDMEANRVLLHRALDSLGKITDATSCDKAAHLLEQESFDIIVTDYETRSSILDGLHLTALAQKRTPAPVVIVWSGKATLIESFGMALGATAVLEKTELPRMTEIIRTTFGFSLPATS